MPNNSTPDIKAVLALTILLILVGIFVPISAGDAPFSTNKKINSGSDSNRVQPDLAVDAGGNVYAVWGDRRNDKWEVYFTWSFDRGVTWVSPDVKVSSVIGNQTYPSNPSIAVNDTGTLYVVWDDSRNGDLDIYFSRSTDSGLTWSDPDNRVSSDLDLGTPNRTQSAPEIAVDSLGNIHVVWQDMRGPDSDIFYARSTDSGETWTNPNIRVNQDSMIVDQNNPSIAIGPSDIIYVAWEEYSGYSYDIYLSKSEDYGVTWSDPHMRVSSDGGPEPQEHPSVGVDPFGNIYVAWQDKRNENDFDIYFAGSSDGGINWTNPNIKVDNSSTGIQKNAALAVSDTGTIYIAWEDSRNNDRDIYFAYSIDMGMNWSKPDLLVNDDDTGSTQLYPTIAVGSVGPVHVAWQDARSTVNDIYSAYIDPVHPFSSVDLLKVEGFLGDTPGIGHIISHDPKLSFTYYDPFQSRLSQYNVSIWDASGASLLWFCNKTDSRPSGSEITIIYNTAPYPTNGPDLVDGTTYLMRVSAANETVFWGMEYQVEFHMNEVLRPYLPITPSNSARIESSFNQKISWTSPGLDSEGDYPVSFTWEVATDPQFEDIMGTDTVNVTHSEGFDTRPSGTFYWRVKLSDGWETGSFGGSDNGYWVFSTYTTSGSNNPPEITNKAGAPTSAYVKGAVSFTFSATDPDNDPLAWSKTNGPGWLNIGSQNGTLYGAPIADDIGSNTFTILVADGKGGFDEHTFTVSVSSENGGQNGDPQEGEDDDIGPFPWWLILILVIIIIFLLLFFLMYKRKKDDEEEKEEHGTEREQEPEDENGPEVEGQNEHMDDGPEDDEKIESEDIKSLKEPQ